MFEPPPRPGGAGRWRAPVRPDRDRRRPGPRPRRRQIESRASLRNRASRCSPTRCPARGAARPRSPTTTCCCATRSSPTRTGPQFVIRIGDLPTSKPLRAWLAGLEDGPDRVRSRRRVARPGRRRRDADPSASSAPGGTLATATPGVARVVARGRRRGRRRDRRGRSATSCQSRSSPARWRSGSARGDAVRRVVDADPRRRGVRPGPRRRTARALEPRRERDRRHGLLGVRRSRGRGGRGTGRAADRRRRARPRHRRAARGAPARSPADDRAAQQRRRRDLPLPRRSRARPTRSRSTSRRRTASTSPAPPRSTAASTSRPDTLAELRDAVETSIAGTATTIIEVRTDREQNLALHRRVAEAALAALRARLVITGRGYPESTGSNAPSLTSVSASSATGSESRTIPPPAYRCATRPRTKRAPQRHAELAVAGGVGPPHRPRVPAAVEPLERRDQRRRDLQRLAADRRRRMRARRRARSRSAARPAALGSAYRGG